MAGEWPDEREMLSMIASDIGYLFVQSYGD